MSEFDAQDIPVVVVMNRDDTVRCIYVNNYRLIGAKPYVSENLHHHHMTMSLEDLRAAFMGDLDIDQASHNGATE